MLNLKNIKYLTDSEGKRIGVVVPIKEYEILIKSWEEVKKLKENNF
jgi:hypothetical protein